MRKFFELPAHVGIYVLSMLLAVTYLYEFITRPIPLVDVVREVASSVVVIDCADYVTAGFIATHHGHILTVSHGILECENSPKTPTVRFLENYSQVYPAHIVRYNNDLDVAVLQTEMIPIASPLDIDSSIPEVGSRATIIGHPEFYFWSVEDGVVSANRISKAGHLIQVSSHVSPGTSGGPVFNEHGKVIGIAMSYIPGNSEIGFAVPGDILKAMLTGL